MIMQPFFDVNKQNNLSVLPFSDCYSIIIAVPLTEYSSIIAPPFPVDC